MAEKRSPFEKNPVIEAYKCSVDRSLLRENLKCSVEERFLRLQALQRFSESLKNAPLRKPDSD